MIACGMPVQIRRCGTTLPVERLAIGDLVYDPMSNNYNEIVDILCRDSAKSSGLLCRIAKGRVVPGVPSRDLLVSGQQPIGHLVPAAAGQPARLVFAAARDLGDVVQEPSRLFALFVEQPACVAVAGAVLQVLDPSCLCSAAETAAKAAAGPRLAPAPPSPGIPPSRPAPGSAGSPPGSER